MQESLEAIHREQGAQLVAFEGDAEPFEASRPHLEACLDARYATEAAKPSPVLIVVASVIGALLLLWMGYSWWQAHKWSSFVDSLRAQPGIVVADEGTKSGKYFVSGLRDPLARDPNELLKEAGVDPSDVVAKWEPYISFAPPLLPERAKLMLEPPDTVQLSVENNAIVATGKASHLWIVDARRIVRAMPGVAGLDERGLVDTDFEEMMVAKQQLESTLLRFEVGAPSLAPGQEAELKKVADAISALQDGVRKRGVKAQIRIMGHTDSSGTEAMNAQLSQQRAETIYAELTKRGADATTAFEPVGVATGKPVREESTPEDAAMNRSVTFEVTIDSGR
jgi:OOP family OmpA-OmpF porin